MAMGDVEAHRLRGGLLTGCKVGSLRSAVEQCWRPDDAEERHRRPREVEEQCGGPQIAGGRLRKWGRGKILYFFYYTFKSFSILFQALFPILTALATASLAETCRWLGGCRRRQEVGRLRRPVGGRKRRR